jgi:hypothetical protein
MKAIITTAAELLSEMSLAETKNESARVKVATSDLGAILGSVKNRLSIEWCDCGEYTDVWTTGKKKQRAIVYHA